MKKVIMALGVALVFTLALAVMPSQGWEQCTTYYNSSMTWVGGYGAACAYTGGSCTECSDSSGIWCVDEEGGAICEGLDINNI